MTNTHLSAIATVIIGTVLMALTFATAPAASLISLVTAYAAWLIVTDYMKRRVVYVTAILSIVSLFAGVVAIVQTLCTIYALTA